MIAFDEKLPSIRPVSGAAEEYISALAATLFGPSKQGLWAMLSAYFDESGTHPGSPICVVAGLVASPKQWARFTPAWLKILDDFGLPEFHMKHCAHFQGPFAKWDKATRSERRDKLFERLMPLIRRTVSYRVWTAIVMGEYRSMYPHDTEEENPYRIAAMGCASRLRWLAMQRGQNDLMIPYVFEHGGKGSAAIFRAFERLMNEGQEDFYRMSALTVANRQKFPPLQAADLHAYEVHKYFADQMAGTPRLRKSFRALLQIPETHPNQGGYLMNGKKLLALAKGLKLQDEENSDGPVALEAVS